MKILVAKSAGYCFGVRDAVKVAYETSKNEGDVYMLGTIVHNERVVENLEKSGAKVVEKLSPNLARRTARSGLNNLREVWSCTHGSILELFLD